LHGGLAHNLKVNIHWIEAEGVVGTDWDSQLSGYDGIPGARRFRQARRGWHAETPSATPANARSPISESAWECSSRWWNSRRNGGVCGLADADSTEFNPGTPHRVIFKLRELKGIGRPGRTHAAGRLALPPDREQLRLPGLRQARDPRAPSPSLRIQSRVEERLRAAGLRNHRRNALTAPTWRSARSPTTLGIWAASSIPNSSPSPWSRTRC